MVTELEEEYELDKNAASAGGDPRRSRMASWVRDELFPVTSSPNNSQPGEARAKEKESGGFGNSGGI